MSAEQLLHRQLLHSSQKSSYSPTLPAESDDDDSETPAAPTMLDDKKSHMSDKVGKMQQQMKQAHDGKKEEGQEKQVCALLLSVRLNMGNIISRS